MDGRFIRFVTARAATMRRLFNVLSSQALHSLVSIARGICLFILYPPGFLKEACGGSFDLGTFVAKSASLPQFTRDFYS